MYVYTTAGKFIHKTTTIAATSLNIVLVRDITLYVQSNVQPNVQPAKVTNVMH